MKNMKKRYTLLMLLISIYAIAQDIIPSDAIDLAQGNIYFQNGGYSVGSSSGVLISHDNAYNIYSTEEVTGNLMFIQSGAGKLDIAIWNMTNNKSAGILLDKSESDIVLRAHDHNQTLGTSRGIGIVGTIKHTMTIVGDSLSLGGPITGSEVTTCCLNLDYCNIDISVSGDNCIGKNDSHLAKITVEDSCVLTSSAGFIYADTIIIGKASVNIWGMSVPAINPEGDTVYCVKVPRNGVNTATVTNTQTSTSEDYTFNSSHPNDDNYYIYLPNGSYELSTNGVSYNATIEGTATIATLNVKTGDGIIDVSGGTVTINDTMYYVGSQPYSYVGRNFTFSGISTSGITVLRAVDTLVFNGIDIEVEGGCAFNIDIDTDVVVVLAEGTTNTLISGYGYAGLQKNRTEGMLTIAGEGTLTASSGDDESVNFGCGGIGSAKDSSFANLTIKSGTITAIGAYGSSAIGAGGGTGNSSNINIEGGQLTLSCSGTNPVLDVNSTISGGIVTLSGSRYALKGSRVTGGTVIANQSNSSWLFGSGVILSGGELITTTNLADVSLSRPHNSSSVAVYRSRYQIPNISSSTAVDSITINGSAWNCNDVYTDTMGVVFLWLPVSDADTVVISANGESYTYLGEIVAYDDYVEADRVNDIPEYGNYWWQVPVTIAEPENGTLTITNGDSVLASGIYVCNNTVLTATAAPEEGYLCDSIMANGLTIENVSSITAIDSLGFSVAFSMQTFTFTQSITGEGTLTISDGINVYTSETSVYYGTELVITTEASEGYQLDSMMVNGAITTSTDTTITITSNTELAAYFSEIPNSISDITLTKNGVYSQGKIIYVHCVANTEIRVYNINGTLICKRKATSNRTSIPVSQSGLYIIKIIADSGEQGAITKKCIVR